MLRQELIPVDHVAVAVRARHPPDDRRVPAARAAYAARASAAGIGVVPGRDRHAAAPVERTAPLEDLEAVQQARGVHPAETARLAIGDDVEPGLLLQPDRVADGVVDHGLVGQAAAAHGTQHRVAAQQAADDLCPGLSHGL